LPHSLHVGFRIVIGKGAIGAICPVCWQFAPRWQQGVNHVGGTVPRYAPLTSEIKPIPKLLWHAARNVRTHKKASPAGSDL
jgi:hypothetical protein